MKRTLAALLIAFSLSPAARAQDFDMGGSFAWMLEAMMEAMVTFMDRMRDPVGGYGGSPWGGVPGFSNPWSSPWSSASPWAPGAGGLPGYGGWPGSGGPWGGPWSGAGNPWAGPGGAANYMPKLNGAWYGADGSLLYIQADRFQLGASGGGVVRGGINYLPNGFIDLRPAGGRVMRYEYAVIDDFLLLRDAGGQPVLFHRIPEAYLRGW